MNAVYLDYAAASPMDERVLAAMQPYFSERFYNPSATYWAAHETAKELQDARARLASHLGARPVELTCTAGGTEANNLAIHGIMAKYPTASVVVSAIEHESVLRSAQQYTCREAPVQADGLIDLAALERTIDDTTVLVSVMYANNEVGTIQPIRDIARLLETIRSRRRQQGNELPLYFHTDAAQVGNYLDLHVARLGVDMLSLNGGKLYGPKQSGLLYVRGGIVLEPLIYGGGQEHGIRSGTENVPAVMGLAMALDIAQDMRRDETRRLQELQHHFIDSIQAKLPDAQLNGSRKKRLPNNIHLTLPGTDNERLLFALDEAGIMAAAGSACSASSEESSHVLLAMGLSDAEARSSLRFTMGRATTTRDVDRAIATLVDILAA